MIDRNRDPETEQTGIHEPRKLEFDIFDKREPFHRVITKNTGEMCMCCCCVCVAVCSRQLQDIVYILYNTVF